MAMPTTVSMCTSETHKGKHVFEIIDYSQHKGIGCGEEDFIRSGTFSVGGHDWCIRFYTDGAGKEYTEHIAVFLQLVSRRRKVRASCDLRLVNQVTGSSSSLHMTEARMFNSNDVSRFAPQTREFIKRSELEASVYLREDRLTIECIVTVFKEPRVSQRKTCPEIQVPPSDIFKDLGKLLESGEGADIEFSVMGQNFVAHRLVLAMRSPVFKAELCGPMKEAKAQTVTIREMQPAVFKALLHYIYTDSLPALDGLSRLDRNEMIRCLLVAADRYAMDKLNMMCQIMLYEDLDVKNMVTTLAFADQHHCEFLKDVCIEFISSSRTNNDAVVGFGHFVQNSTIRYFVYIALVAIVGWLCLVHCF
ncbi:unnamed protein product [Urochloa decumbens]|uniref:Uncharacterized protein n=1 Tax=Urochloa decumbens TaxID=240449 RepID=A0ABC9BZJ8_9POAL